MQVSTKNELDGVGPVDNRPSTDKLHHTVQKKKKKNLSKFFRKKKKIIKR